MKKFKITLAIIACCLLSSAVQAGPTKQKPPVAAEVSIYQKIIILLGLTE